MSSNHKSLQDFITAVKSEGLAKLSHFVVHIAPPNMLLLTNKNGKLLEKVSLYCQHAQVPGLNILTTQTKIFGEIREMPYERFFDPLYLEFLVDRTMKVKLFFDEWITAIQNKNTRNFTFYNDYISDKITVEIHDIANNAHYAIEFYEAYPKSLQPIDLHYGAADFMRIQVLFAYKYWRVVELDHLYAIEDGSHGIRGITIVDSTLDKSTNITPRISIR